MDLNDFLASMDSDEMPDELVDVDELIHGRENEGRAPAMPPETMEDFEMAIQGDERTPDLPGIPPSNPD
jgi:hypothetical protein